MVYTRVMFELWAVKNDIFEARRRQNKIYIGFSIVWAATIGEGASLTT